ncbi:MAG: type II toxin-antitoxin system VapC family toxin [Acidobacteria bacterium]|nr:type II toxin-antitoxin system VapC family toxin [Acidobacteriota bacterium]
MKLPPAATFVPDASVILKWVLVSADEPGYEAASQVFKRWQEGEIGLAVPALWAYEVGNVLCLKRPADAAEVLTTLCDLGLNEVPLTPTLIQQTVALASRHGITFYDASYLAVAEEVKAILLTADARFLRRLPDGLPVRLLS